MGHTHLVHGLRSQTWIVPDLRTVSTPTTTAWGARGNGDYASTGACGLCHYEASVGIGRDEDATVPMHWAPANCPSCGLVFVNAYSYGFDTEPRCHECGELVEFYVDWGMVPEPPGGWPCPAWGQPALGFKLAPEDD